MRLHRQHRCHAERALESEQGDVIGWLRSVPAASFLEGQESACKKPGDDAGLLFSCRLLWAEPDRSDHDAASPLPIAGPRSISMPAARGCRIASAGDIAPAVPGRRGDVPSILHFDQRWIVDRRLGHRKRRRRSRADGEKCRCRSKSQFGEVLTNSFFVVSADTRRFPYGDNAAGPRQRSNVPPGWRELIRARTIKYESEKPRRLNCVRRMRDR